jgi:uncharacterized protein with HEPN domain
MPRSVREYLQHILDEAEYLAEQSQDIDKDSSALRSVKVEGGTIAWDNGADIDPDVLY